MADHILTVMGTTKNEDYEYHVECLGKCWSWQECRKDHVVDGREATDPYDCEPNDPWEGVDEFDFHGVTHVYNHNGWCEKKEECALTVNDVSTSAYDILAIHGPGSYLVEDEWWDDYNATLTFVEKVSD